MIAACILLSGSLFGKAAWFADLLNLAFLSSSTFYIMQAKYLTPVINFAWLREKTRVFQMLMAESLTIAGDGRCDSPGYSAKYGTYTAMDTKTKLVIDFNVVQVAEASSSVAMEKLGFQRVMDSLKAGGLKVTTVVTDRSPQIKALMSKSFTNISHQFDVWHFIKSTCKRIRKAAKNKDCGLLAEWLPSISRHFWWAVATSEGNHELLREKWTYVLYHIVNRHSWARAKFFKRCAHKPLTLEQRRKKKWLKADTVAFTALSKIVEDSRVLKDLQHLTGFCHTRFVEVYHNLMLKYCQKREHFSHAIMNKRTQLTAFDNNYNVGRKQARRKDGVLRYSTVHPKQKKEWVARKIYEKKKYGYLEDILQECVEHANGTLDVPEVQKVALPANIAKSTAPPKEDLVSKLVSRMPS